MIKSFEIKPLTNKDIQTFYLKMPVLKKSAQSNFEEVFNIMNPVFLPGVDPDNLFTTNVYVGVSIIKNTPLLTDSGNFQLVSFLGSLPQPSIIVLADYLNRHNMKAMARTTRGKISIPSDEKAIESAMKEAEEYYRIFKRSLNRLEITEPEKASKITLLGWRDVETENMKKQQAIMYNYYQNMEQFKHQIGNESFSHEIAFYIRIYIHNICFIAFKG